MIAELYFYFISFSSLVYVLFRVRRVDFFTVAVVCALYYAHPLYVGYIFDPVSGNIISLSTGVYLVYSLVFSATLVFAFLFDSSFGNTYQPPDLIKNSKRNPFTISISVILLAAFVVSLFLSIVILDFDSLVSQGKSVVVDIGARYAFFVWGAMLLLAISFASGQRVLVFVSALMVLFTLLIGARSYFAASLISIFMLIVRSGGNVRLILQAKYIFFGVLAFVFLFIYKLVYLEVLQGDFSSIIDNLTNLDQYFFRLFQGGEAQLVVLNLDNVVNTYGYFGIDEDYFFSLFYRVFPFVSVEVGSIFGVDVLRFSSVLNARYYSSLSYGMASSFWAEALYAGGWIFLFVYIFIFGWLLFFGSFFLKYVRSNLAIGFVVVPMSYCSFYIHRLEIALVLYSFFICLFYYFCAKFPAILFSSFPSRRCDEKTKNHSGN